MDLIKCHILPYVSHISPLTSEVKLTLGLRTEDGCQNIIQNGMAKSTSQNTTDNYPVRDSWSSFVTHVVTTRDTVDPISCIEPLLHNADRCSSNPVAQRCSVCRKVINTDFTFSMGMISNFRCTKFNLYARPLQFITENYLIPRSSHVGG